MARRSCIDRQFEKDAGQPTQENHNQPTREREREKEREESVSLADILGESPVILRLRVYLCLLGVLCCLLLDSSLISVPSCCLFLSCYFITLLSVVRLILQRKEKDQSIKKKVDSERKTKDKKQNLVAVLLFHLCSLLLFCSSFAAKFTTQAEKPQSTPTTATPAQVTSQRKEINQTEKQEKQEEAVLIIIPGAIDRAGT